MKVELVALTCGVGKYSELDQEEITSAIARHGIIKEDNGKLVKYLMNEKHFSPLDMVNFVFEVETSRAIGRQILRHASIKFQEHSQRYSESAMFEPIELRKEHPTNRQSSTEEFNPTWYENVYGGIMDGEEYKQSAINAIKEHMQEVAYLYSKLIKSGVAKECARMILPECTTTTMTANGTLRSWLSFLNVRCGIETQKEAREIALSIGNILEKECPDIMAVLNWKEGHFM